MRERKGRRVVSASGGSDYDQLVALVRASRETTGRGFGAKKGPKERSRGDKHIDIPCTCTFVRCYMYNCTVVQCIRYASGCACVCGEGFVPVLVQVGFVSRRVNPS